MEAKFGIEEVYAKPLIKTINEAIRKDLNKELGMSKTFTLEEVRTLVSKGLNIDSPIGQKVMHQFEDAPIGKQVKDILYKMNHNRFSNSGYVHIVKDELGIELEKQLHNQIDVQFQKEELTHKEMELDLHSFTTGYLIGMGAVSLGRMV